MKKTNLTANKRQNGKAKGKRRTVRSGKVRDGVNIGQLPVALSSSKLTWLKYVDGSDQRAAAGVNWGVWRLKLTDVYDPDPLLLTGGITGYNEFSAFFNRWRVISTHLSLTVTNRESFPMHFAILLAPSDISTFLSSRALALDAMERPGCIYHRELAAQGGMDRVTFNRRLNLKSILGDAYTLRAGDFDGSVSSSPVRNLYAHFIIVAPTTVTTIANGIFYDLTISYLVKFFDVLPKLLGMSEIDVLQKRISLLALAATRREAVRKSNSMSEHAYVL
jgi:hypothetical protein